MKMVEAIIKPFTLESVKNALSRVGINGITVTEIRGFGRQRGHTTRYQGSEYSTEFVPKLRIQVAVQENMLDGVVESILRSARTGEIGDGKIFIHDLESVTRIRTGERGDTAI